MTIDEWADAYLTLPSQTSAERGPYRTSRTPYVREPLRELSPSSPTRDIVCMWASQTGKTTMGLAWIGYTVHLTPCPMMMVLPSIEGAEDASKERIVPLLELPVLKDKVRENKSRDGSNTIRRKWFTGGFLKLAGANSAKSLRMTPIKNLFPDEVDGYPLDVDGEGDPLALAQKRMLTFRRGKMFATSTPGLKHASRIEKLYLKSDQRRYFVPCPHCNPEADRAKQMDFMRWVNLDYRNNDPTTATLLCSKCGALIEEHHKTWMLDHGEWRPTAVGDGVTVGFHLNGLYSPVGWFSWTDAVRQWIDAQQDPSLLKVFVNTVLAETYESRTEAVDPDAIFARAETYSAEVPDGVGILVASVDVQADRLEFQVKGYGAGEQSWLIDWGAIVGDPSQDQVWFDLDEKLLRPRVHESGKRLRIECVAVDSNYKADKVYEFCKLRASRRVFAVRGGKETGKPLVPRPTNKNAYRTRLYTLCTDTGKEMVFARLRIAKPGAGYMHLPEWIDREYVDQLTAERLMKEIVKGKAGQRLVTKWKKIRDRNEALDLEVYCLAALRIALGPRPGPQLLQRAARLATKKPSPPGAPPPDAGPETPAAGQPAPSPSPDPRPPVPPAVQRRTPPSRPRRGWVQGWRR